MKKSHIKNNPTAYFMQQSEATSTEFKEKINEFVSKLINLKSCVLCKEDFNFSERIPRILIHCGHTFCSSCLGNFYKNNRVRCPMCLKLIKHIDSIERLPVNHTIFSRLAEEQREKNKKEGGQVAKRFEEIAQKKFMGPMTAAIQKEKEKTHDEEALFNNYMKGNGPVNPPEEKDLPEINWETCDYHDDRVKHFYCTSHQNLCCRVCKDAIHSRKECMVVDLYEIEDPKGFLEEMAEIHKGESNTFENEQDLEVKSTNSL